MIDRFSLHFLRKMIYVFLMYTMASESSELRLCRALLLLATQSQIRLPLNPQSMKPGKKAKIYKCKACLSIIAHADTQTCTRCWDIICRSCVNQPSDKIFVHHVACTMCSGKLPPTRYIDKIILCSECIHRKEDFTDYTSICDPCAGF